MFLKKKGEWLRSSSKRKAAMGEKTVSKGVCFVIEYPQKITEKHTVISEGEKAMSKEFDWQHAPAPIAESCIAETLEADVAIIGCGYSGLSLFRTLAEQGIRTVILEEMPREKWWTIGRDIGHINSRFLEKHGVPKVDAVEFINNWMVQTHNKVNPAFVSAFARESGETVDWFLEPIPQEILDQARITFWPDNEYTVHELNTGLKYYTGTAQFWKKPMADGSTQGVDLKEISRINLEYVLEKYPHAQIRFGTKGVQLVEKDGRICGVIAQGEDGEYVQINAGKAVVLCGGGFSGNKDMCRALLPTIARSFTGNEDFKGFAGVGRDGSTIAMGLWAGGRMESEISTMNYDSVRIPDSVIGSLWLDADGHRFQNEAFGGPEVLGYYVPRAKKRVMISVFDSSIDRQLLRGVAGHGALDYSDPEAVESVLKHFRAAEGAGAEGVKGYYCADTLEELADMLGFDREAFRKEIAHYNDLCHAGRDTDFGKDPRFMEPVEKAPFYAHVTKPTVGFALETTGGLVTTSEQQVVDGDYEPIPGLYASGNTCGLRFGSGYVTPIPGVSIGMCLTLARHLGKQLAEEVGQS